MMLRSHLKMVGSFFWLSLRLNNLGLLARGTHQSF